ncbi:entericidin A/B family lipoprotein [Brevundimonas sp. 2R-24]|uniref:Entericidin A/B family lipoprotein n=1 Tax=Peiella sedimenti TaxID=3061083 RepID=A0ABT8SMJ0_9CAUL|nr:entericidin A/B family lipoprotein [Caulobacteraceae bacterium XZ-24]
MTRAKTMILLGLAALGLTACNTIAGIGRDMRAAGQAVEETAEDVRR